MDNWIDYQKLAAQLGLTENDVQSLVGNSQTLAGNLQITEQNNAQVIDAIISKPDLPTPFLHKNNVTIHHEDFVNSNIMPDESVDLIVTSPPYNVGIEYQTHDDTREYSHYLSFSRQWLTQAYRIARADGRLCMNIPLDKNKGGQQSVAADVTTIAKEIGWHYHSTIIWNEGNISRRTAWGSWMSASAPYVIAPVEVIVVLYKQQWKKARKNGENDITRDDFMKWTNGVWTFNGESKKRIGHPAPFPLELPKRCIKLFSYVGDTVLDPFVGSGTTLIEAWNNNRVGVGFDISSEYCELAQKRLEKAWSQFKLV